MVFMHEHLFASDQPPIHFLLVMFLNVYTGYRLCSALSQEVHLAVVLSERREAFHHG